MASYKFLCLLSLITMVIHFGQVVFAQLITRGEYYCEGDGMDSIQYRRNLNLLLNSIPSEVTTGKIFYNKSMGEIPDRVYGILLCRGDVTNDACKICAQTATTDAPKDCPDNKEFISWYDDCMIRYSHRYIFSVMEIKPQMIRKNPNNVTNQEEFGQLVSELMDGLVRKAAFDSGSSNKKFATGEANFSLFQTIYGMAECTPDISGSDCNRCLRGAVYASASCCFGRNGTIVLRGSCDIRYELYPFYEVSTTETQAPPPPNETTTGGKGKKSSNINIIIIVIPSVVALILLFVVALLLYSRKKACDRIDYMKEITRIESLQFDFSTLSAATDNFSDANKLGEGGFGVVYKGKRSNGQEIAVKRLSTDSKQGEKEFKNEVGLLVKLQHVNLVRLLGFCLEEKEKLLIYEFVQNGSLDHFIFDPNKRANLNWETRYKIIEGIVSGLLYLHIHSRLRIIHLDLKASNVLLDEKMEPKISDFGMAKLFEMEQTRGDTSRAVGTLGYMSPEYLLYGQFSVKSDVYSFGVLLLEIVTGESINRFYYPELAENLLNYVWRHWEEKRALELIDPTMRDSYSESEVMRCIQIGLLSVQDVTRRPTMASVVLMLTSDAVALPLPSPPAFFDNSRMQSGMPTKDNESRDKSSYTTNNSSKSKQYWSISEV